MRTRDQGVRGQLEAVKGYLRLEGLADADDPPDLQLKAFDTNRHTIRVTFNGMTRFLRLDYGWLSHHPTDTVAWLQERYFDPSQRDDRGETLMRAAIYAKKEGK